MRVVSLLPSATEIVFALGHGDDVVGVTFECDFPDAARSRRVVSISALPEGLSPAEIDEAVAARLAAGEDLYRLDEQALADLNADLVLTQDLCAVCAVDLERVDEALAYLGCSAEVLTLDPGSLDDVLASIVAVGRVLDADDAARALVHALRERLARLETLLTDAPRKAVLVLEWTDPPFSAGHWVPDVVSAGGGRTLLANPGQDSQRVAWEAIAGVSADVVLVAPCGYHLDAASELAEELVRGNHLPASAEVWAVDADSHFVRPGPRLVDGAEVVARILHPGLAGASDPHEARQIQG